MKSPTVIVPTTSVPVYPLRSEWPPFAPSEKPSVNSPFTTTMRFGPQGTPGWDTVRIIVEGRDKATVDAIAKAITGE